MMCNNLALPRDISWKIVASDAIWVGDVSISRFRRDRKVFRCQCGGGLVFVDVSFFLEASSFYVDIPIIPYL